MVTLHGQVSIAKQSNVELYLMESTEQSDITEAAF